MPSRGVSHAPRLTTTIRVSCTAYVPGGADFPWHPQNDAGTPGVHENSRPGSITKGMQSMKLSEFWRSMDDEFGAGYARVVASQTVLDRVENRTAQEALDDGVRPLDVWQAVCAQHDLPRHRWLGTDVGEPK